METQINNLYNPPNKKESPKVASIEYDTIDREIKPASSAIKFKLGGSPALTAKAKIMKLMIGKAKFVKKYKDRVPLALKLAIILNNKGLLIPCLTRSLMTPSSL